MTKATSTSREFELELLFFAELAAGYRSARDAQERFLRKPANREPVGELGDFFHRIAGTAQAVGHPVLGSLAAMSERIARRIVAGAPYEPHDAAQLFAYALAGVAAALDSRGAGATERPLADPADIGGIAIPTALGEGRELSKVLVVDDDKLSAEMIDNCLRSAGFMSAYTCDPEQALKVIAEELPDLIIMDVVMPGIDGFELCRRVREHPPLQFTPIIFVTRRGDVDQRVRGLEVGGNDYIAKPFEPQELVARVRSHLSRLAALREMAIRDGLTRCYNHKFFRHRLRQEVQRASRYKEPLSLAMLDIDHFKLVNDSYGHRAGDAVLSEMASLVSASVRATDVVARYGGEEFAIMMIHAGVEEAKIVCSRLRERISAHEFSFTQVEPDVDQPVAIGITISIGLAELAGGKESSEGLIGRADKALYAAKHAGRNRVETAEPLG